MCGPWGLRVLGWISGLIVVGLEIGLVVQGSGVQGVPEFEKWMYRG